MHAYTPPLMTLGSKLAMQVFSFPGQNTFLALTPFMDNGLSSVVGVYMYMIKNGVIMFVFVFYISGFISGINCSIPEQCGAKKRRKPIICVCCLSCRRNRLQGIILQKLSYILLCYNS